MTVCRRCGAPAPYFTDTYDPSTGERMSIPLCREHQQELVAIIRGDIEGKVVTVWPRGAETTTGAEL